MDACRDVDAWFRYYKDSPLEHYFIHLIGNPVHPLVADMREKVGMKLISYRLDEISNCFYRLMFDLDLNSEKFLRKLFENVVDVPRWIRIFIRSDYIDMRKATNIFLEMGQDTELTTEQRSYFVRNVVKNKTGYETGRSFVEQLFVIDMILHTF